MDDDFHIKNHPILRTHLRPYRIRDTQLPYIAKNIPRHLTNCSKVVILTPPELVNKYQGLKSNMVDVKQYRSDADIVP